MGLFPSRQRGPISQKCVCCASMFPWLDVRKLSTGSTVFASSLSKDPMTPAIATSQSNSEIVVEEAISNCSLSTNDAAAPSAQPRARRKRTAESTASSVARRQKKKPKQKQKEKKADLDMSWICAECREAECLLDSNADQLLVCEGSCGRVFHYPCAGLTEMPSENEPYVCKDCIAGKHACAFCQEYGVDDEEVFKCSQATCGLFFHESCLRMRNVEVTVITSSSNEISSPSPVSVLDSPASSQSATVKLETAKRVFTCPAHSCWSCTQVELKNQEDNQSRESSQNVSSKARKGTKKTKSGNGCFAAKKESKLFRCLECPISYHISCIPLSAKFHELAILCHEHAGTCKLPDLDPQSSMQGEVEKKADSFVAKTHGLRVNKMRRRGISQNLCFPFTGEDMSFAELAIKQAIPSRTKADVSMGGDSLLSSFCLPSTLREEVHSKPPAYKHVHTLQYDPKNKPQAKPPTGDRCDCIGTCDESCYNRMVFTECYGDINKSGETNCNAGPYCTNRGISQRMFAKCKPQREEGKGWGLMTLDRIQEGQLVQEYVGEIIDTKTKEERLVRWNEDHPNDPNFYIMALKDKWYIDAREVANLSRFINHSCDPNCIIHPVNVRGFWHNGVFALRDIEPGEFLSYDYHFDTQQGDRFVCRCGSSNCRGTMSTETTTTEETNKSSPAETWEKAKSQFDKDKKYVADFYEEEASRRIAFGEGVPGSVGKEDAVANGPNDRHKETVLSNHLFLWRNAMQGDRLARRIARVSKTDYK